MVLFSGWFPPDCQTFCRDCANENKAFAPRLGSPEREEESGHPSRPRRLLPLRHLQQLAVGQLALTSCQSRCSLTPGPALCCHPSLPGTVQVLRTLIPPKQVAAKGTTALIISSQVDFFCALVFEPLIKSCVAAWQKSAEFYILWPLICCLVACRSLCTSLQ